jgi:hypothetical protein
MDATFLTPSLLLMLAPPNLKTFTQVIIIYIKGKVTKNDKKTPVVAGVQNKNILLNDY